MLVVRTNAATVDTSECGHSLRQYCGNAVNARVKQRVSPSMRHRCRA